MAFPDPTVSTTYVSSSGILYEWDPVLEAWSVSSGNIEGSGTGSASVTISTNDGDLLV